MCLNIVKKHQPFFTSDQRQSLLNDKIVNFLPIFPNIPLNYFLTQVKMIFYSFIVFVKLIITI